MPRKRQPQRTGLYQRPRSPYWWASWVDENGARRRKSTGCVEYEAAKRKRAEFVLGVAPELKPKAMAMSELINMYTEDLAIRSRMDEMPSAITPVENFFANHRLPLRPPDVRKFRHHLEGRGLAPTTINNYMNMLSTILNWGIRELEINMTNPVRGRKPSPGSARTRYFSKDEAVRLITAVEQCEKPFCHELADGIRLMLAGGLRVTEALELRWSQIDTTGQVIKFNAATQKIDKLASVPLNNKIREVLAKRQKVRHISNDFVLQHDGKTFGRNAASVLFGRIAKQIGINDAQLRDFRRTSGTWLLQDGASIYDVSIFLRHENVGITQRHYAFLSDEQKHDTAGRLDSLMDFEVTPYAH